MKIDGQIEQQIRAIHEFLPQYEVLLLNTSAKGRFLLFIQLNTTGSHVHLRHNDLLGSAILLPSEV